MKRRKSTRSDPGTSPQEKVVKTAPKEKVNAEILNIDEKDAEKSDAASDVKSYRMACDEIRKLIEEINDLKSEGKQSNSPEINERRIRCTLLFLIVKKLNRLAHVRCKKARDTTQEAKQKVDGLHLQLQNLLYEVMHLRKEITKCLEFKSKDEEIDLVSEEEFYQEAPREFSKPDITKNDPHQKMLARLDWELEQRKRYASQKEESSKRKDQLAKEIKTKRGFLDSLQPRLESILKATHPVQEYLNMPLDEQRAQHETAKFLPMSLYVLFVQATAYHEACDKHLDVQIHGDVEAAKAVLEEKPMIKPDDDSDSDAEGPEEATDKSRRSKRRRKKEESRMLEEKKALLKKHPLQVLLQLNFKNKNCLKLVFSYLPTLNIVTAVPMLSLADPGEQPVLATSKLLSPESILDNLFPGDHGNSPPNPTNQFQLTKVGIPSFSSCIKTIGRPFLWAQRICGLEFLDNDLPVVAKSQLSSSHMEETINALRNRMLARLALHKQLASLEGCRIPTIETSRPLFPLNIKSVLASWKPIPYTDFAELPYVKNLVAEGLITETNMCYTAEIHRGSRVKLLVGAVLYQDYPVNPPLFCLCIDNNGTMLSGEMVKLIEAEVNVHYHDLMEVDSPNNILTNQLKRLQMCFDVLIDCGYLNNDFNMEQLQRQKLLVRGLRGRLRSLPFKYDSSQGLFIHR